MSVYLATAASHGTSGNNWTPADSIRLLPRVLHYLHHNLKGINGLSVPCFKMHTASISSRNLPFISS